MKNKLLCSIIPLLFISLFACSNNEKVETEDDFINKFKLNLTNLSSNCNYVSGHQSDEYYYGAISTVINETNNKTRYKDNFTKINFKQDYDSSIVNGTKEIGVINNKFYQIVDYGEGDSNNYVQYINYDEKYIESNIGIGFSATYFTSSYDTCKNLADSSESKKYKFEYNYHDVDITKDGEVELYLIYEQYSNKEVTIKYERADKLVIKDKKIIKSVSTILYSLMDNTNYIYSNSSFDYSYGEYKVYDETKLDPNNYQEKTN